MSVHSHLLGWSTAGLQTCLLRQMIICSSSYHSTLPPWFATHNLLFSGATATTKLRRPCWKRNYDQRSVHRRLHTTSKLQIPRCFCIGHARMDKTDMQVNGCSMRCSAYHWYYCTIQARASDVPVESRCGRKLPVTTDSNLMSTKTAPDGQ
jgi:hypothetical protein